ncbi:MAG TPA: ABC transporter substrate-binding protein [Bacteroidota bacterium]|nr:ABC transporter substrate-binding protein [Bacteroidota bacterium]
MISSKRFYYLFILIVLFLFGYCNNKNQKDNKIIKSQSTLVIALINDIDSFNPITTTDVTSNTIQDIIFPALTGIKWNDSIGIVEYTPLLAKSWEISDDEKSITFHLKNNILWSNGEKIKVKDIIYSYKLYSNPLTASPQQFLFSNFYKKNNDEIDEQKSFSVLNDSVLQINFKTKTSNPLQFSILKIIPDSFYQTDLKKLSQDPKSFNPISAGPYKLKEWVPNQRIVLLQNEKYNLGPKPNIEKIIFKVIPDYTTRLIALKTGEIDFMEGIRPEDTKELKKSNPNIQILPLNDRTYEFVCWNNIDNIIYKKYKQIKPHRLFGNKNVRKALTLAIDRQEIIDGFLMEYGKICNGPVSPIFKWAYNYDLKPVPYDPQTAKSILRKEGWYDRNGDGIIDKDGLEFRFNLCINTGSPRREFCANMIKNYLKKIGIEVNVQKLEWNLFETRIINRELDAFINGMAVSSDLNLFEFWYSDFEKASLNDAGYRSKRADEILEEISKQNYLKSATLFKELQKIIYDDEPCTFLYWYSNIIGYNKHLKNVKSNIWDSYNQISEWVKEE